MKSYIEKQVLYYTLVCSSILNEDEAVILEKIAPLFTCSEKETGEIKAVLENEEFKILSSELGIIMRQNYIDSFGKYPPVFGSTADEAAALEVKLSAYNILTELQKDLHATVDLRAAVAHIAEKDSKMQILYALLLYCQNKKDKLVVTYLKNSARDEQLDARILLHFFAESQEQRQAYFAEMEKCTGSRIYPEIIKQVAQWYKLSTGI